MSATDCTQAIASGKPINRQARHSDKYKRISERSKEEEEPFKNIHTKLQDVIITSFLLCVLSFTIINLCIHDHFVLCMFDISLLMMFIYFLSIETRGHF